MNTCNCLRQQSIPNYTPMKYIAINDAIELVRTHKSYDNTKHTLKVKPLPRSPATVISISLNGWYTREITFIQGSKSSLYFEAWLGDTFDFFNKMEELSDIL